MAYATVSVPGDGSTTLITVSFPLGWIDVTDVRIRVSGEVDGAGDPVYRAYTRLSDSLYQISGTAAAVGQNYIFERRVDKENLVVDWEDGDAITEENLNKAQKQAIMIGHEALDLAERAVKVPEGQEGYAIDGDIPEGTTLMISNGVIGEGPYAGDIQSAQSYAVAAYAAQLAAEAAAAVIPSQVANRTEMKALNTAIVKVAFLKENGREGLFKWTLGNYSAYIAADKSEGIYIKAANVAATVGAWVRQGGWTTHGVDAEWFGVVPNLSSAAAANALALQQALNLLDITTYAGKLNLPLGRTFYNPSGLTIPCILQTRPHAICGSQPGAMPNIDLYEIQDDGTLFVAGSALTLYGDGTSAKRVWTRREYRGSSSDPQDTPRSVGWNCQALGARFEHVMFETWCDYTNKSQSNMGSNWDIHLLGGRMNIQIIGCFARGYPRFKHVLLDGTRGVGLPEVNATYPTDINAKGLDGITIVGFRSNGSSGIALLGPKPKPGLLHPGHQYKRGCKINAAGNPSDGDTVTIGLEVFTFKTTKAYRYEVQIGASAAASLVNLRTEWLIGKQAPYETLTLVNNNTLLEIYSISTSPTAVSETSANLSVQLIGSQTAATQTEIISDPAPYYDEGLGGTTSDGRNSLGGSDFILDDYIISVSHHSGYRMTDKGVDRHTEPDTVHACLHIDGMGGSIFIHKFHIGAGRFESVEPFTVRLGLCGRGSIAFATFDSNLTAWLTTSGGAIASSASWGKVSADRYNTCRVSMFTHDDPSSGYAYFPQRSNGNRLDTNFIKTANSLIVETTAIVGKTITVGDQNNGAVIGFVEVVGGEVGQVDVRFSAKENSQVARIRANPANGQLVTSTKTGGTGSLVARTQQVDDRFHIIGHMSITDGVTAPGTTSGVAKIYVDEADGDLKVCFGDGTVKTIITST